MRVGVEGCGLSSCPPYDYDYNEQLTINPVGAGFTQVSDTPPSMV
jgi:hypothetical protein